MSDWRNSPGNVNNHYGEGDCIQPIEYFFDNHPDFLPASIIKYIVRHKKKNGKEDLQKALWYTSWLRKMCLEPRNKLAQTAGDFIASNKFDENQKEIILLLEELHFLDPEDNYELAVTDIIANLEKTILKMMDESYVQSISADRVNN